MLDWLDGLDPGTQWEVQVCLVCSLPQYGSTGKETSEPEVSVGEGRGGELQGTLEKGSLGSGVPAPARLRVHSATTKAFVVVLECA